jgi:hypothetical protein
MPLRLLFRQDPSFLSREFLFGQGTGLTEFGELCEAVNPVGAAFHRDAARCPSVLDEQGDHPGDQWTREEREEEETSVAMSPFLGEGRNKIGKKAPKTNHERCHSNNYGEDHAATLEEQVALMHHARYKGSTLRG